MLSSIRAKNSFQKLQFFLPEPLNTVPHSHHHIGFHKRCYIASHRQFDIAPPEQFPELGVEHRCNWFREHHDKPPHTWCHIVA